LLLLLKFLELFLLQFLVLAGKPAFQFAIYLLPKLINEDAL